MKVFIDTNVLIDFICNRELFYDDAEVVFSYGLCGKLEIFFTDISIINTLYVGKKYNYTTEELAQQIERTLEYCNLSLINGEVIMRSLSSEWKDKEDAIQYYSATESCVDIIITRNVKDYALSEIRVLTPTEFCEIYHY